MADEVNFRERILGLASAPVKVEWLDLPELGDGGGVYLKVLRGSERDAFQASCLIDHGDGNVATNTNNISARFASWVICDKDGNRLFKREEAGKLGDLPSTVLSKIWDRGQAMNRLGKITAAEAAGNSNGAASD